MARVLIFGYGNPLRGDDGIGWRAAESLRRTIRDEDVEIETSHQLTPEMAETISRAAMVIFIDAACDNKEGELVFREVEPDRSPSGLFTHQLTPEVLLALAERLYGKAPDAMLISVGGASFEYGDRLSAAVESALPALIERVQAVCSAILCAERRPHLGSAHLQS